MPLIHLNSAISTFLLLSASLLCFPGTTKTDNPCPYPCYPPPTGGSVTPATPSGNTAPPAPLQSGSTYQPPAGYYPYNPPPPYGGGGGGSGGAGGSGYYGAPPPPDPILPYFPFYYRKPPHQTEENSAAAALTFQKQTGMITAISLFSLLLHFVQQ